MKTYLLVLFILSSCLCFGQRKERSDFVQRNGPPKWPAYVFILDTTKIIVDSINLNEINPKWIEKIEVIKDDRAVSLYGKENGVVIVYPKKRYFYRITEFLKNKK